MAHISTALEKSSAKRILPPGFKSSSKTNPKAVFLRPGAKNCQSSRLSNHLKLASCRFTVKSRSLPSISSIPKDTSDEETCWRVPTHRVVSPCIEEEWKNSLVDAVFHLFNCDSASSLDGFIFCNLSLVTYTVVELHYSPAASGSRFSNARSGVGQQAFRNATIRVPGSVSQKGWELASEQSIVSPETVPKFGKRLFEPRGRQTEPCGSLTCPARLRLSENILLVRLTPAPLAKLGVCVNLGRRRFRPLNPFTVLTRHGSIGPEILPSRRAAAVRVNRAIRIVCSRQHGHFSCNKQWQNLSTPAIPIRTTFFV
jgi:hypothetical protein